MKSGRRGQLIHSLCATGKDMVSALSRSDTLLGSEQRVTCSDQPVSRCYVEDMLWRAGWGQGCCRGAGERQGGPGKSRSGGVRSGCIPGGP